MGGEEASALRVGRARPREIFFFFASFGDGAGENFPIRNKNLFWSLEGREGMAGRRRGTYYPSLLRCLVTDIGCLLFLA
jgi:hypothetical protein